MACKEQSNTGPFGIPPGGPWFAFGVTGTIQRESDPALAVALASTGWVGFATQKGAKCYIGANPVTKAKHGAHDVKAAAGGVGDFLGRLSQGATWIRVAEAVLGLVLIAIGLARITHAVPIATAVAKKAGAVGVLAA